ncbi:hypothetical protein D3C75_886950 [compost metagenome]
MPSWLLAKGLATVPRTGCTNNEACPGACTFTAFCRSPKAGRKEGAPLKVFWYQAAAWLKSISRVRAFVTTAWASLLQPASHWNIPHTAAKTTPANTSFAWNSLKKGPRPEWRPLSGPFSPAGKLRSPEPLRSSSAYQARSCFCRSFQASSGSPP